jgi:DNA-binding transcriptional LysR family regulator
MPDLNFDSLDLNLLRVFDALYVERSATRAGERLKLSQSTISHSLARFRYFLKDELFIRSATGMAPTPLAVEIGPAVHQLLSQLRTELTAPKFEPSKSERVFSIACGDYMTAVLMPRVLDILRECAPNVHMRLVPMHPTNVEGLDEGRLDLIVATFGNVADKFETELLLEDKLVCVMRRGNPHARPPLTLEQIADLPLVVPSYGTREEDGCSDETLTTWRGLEIRGGWHLGLLSELEERHDHPTAPRRVTLVSLLGALEIISATDFVGVLPSRIVTGRAEKFGLEVLDLPHSAAADPSRALSLQMLSHRTHGAHPAVVWLRQIVLRAASELNS